MYTKGLGAGLLCEVCLHQVPPWDPIFPTFPLYVPKWPKTGLDPYFLRLFKGTHVKIHKYLAVSQEYAGISRSIPYLRMRVGPSGDLRKFVEPSMSSGRGY